MSSPSQAPAPASVHEISDPIGPQGGEPRRYWPGKVDPSSPPPTPASAQATIVSGLIPLQIPPNPPGPDPRDGAPPHSKPSRARFPGSGPACGRQ